MQKFAMETFFIQKFNIIPVGPIIVMIGLLTCTWLKAGCDSFTPFETILPKEEQDFTLRQLGILKARPEPDSFPWKLAIITDTHTGYNNVVDIINQVNAMDDIELVLVIGDMTDFGLREEYRAILHILSELQRPFFTAIGNRDALSNGKEIYTSMFGAFNYSFHFGGLKLVLFNNNTLEFSPDTPDMEWLHSELSASAEPVLAAAHMPPTARLTDALASHKNTIAFVGGNAHETRFNTEPLPVFIAPHGARGRFAIGEIFEDHIQFSTCEGWVCEGVE